MAPIQISFLSMALLGREKFRIFMAKTEVEKRREGGFGHEMAIKGSSSRS